MYTFVQRRGHGERERERKMWMVKFVFPLTSWPFVRSFGRSNERIDSFVSSCPMIKREREHNGEWRNFGNNGTVNRVCACSLFFDEKNENRCVWMCVCVLRDEEERRKGISKTEHETNDAFVRSFISVWRTHVCISFEYETRTRTNEREKGESKDG